MARRYRVQPAPPKPTEAPCPFCEGAYWRYNARDWYACDRVTKRRHVCETPAAVAHREAVEAERRVQQQQALARAERERRWAARWKILLAILATVIAAGIGYAWYTSRHVYHGPPGGTAECNDGWISYAAHHQGACSHHGGVYAWNR